MKWLRHPVDSLIDYTADRFYDRLRDRVLADLAPFAGKELDAARAKLSDLFGWLP
ncbi:hypothetical protein [Mycobacteroides abscessus]|jgi:hypothetical protein|uniref:hypothetical protein n=1 Tax=Mycobacteroides abscessus TaxID=36809 RepID=UPI0019D16DA7|nr:hypothetical protein [Mycobacteroides abscessus]MBN7570219.1 hypothetical protein [Mycobacteroides abscessus subsp. abscessus]